MKNEFRTPFGPRERVILETGPETKTQQHFANEVNINQIMKKAMQTGVMPQISQSPLYGDFSTITNYQDALNMVRDAEDQFMMLPAIVRDRFANNPQQLLNFVGNPENREEAVKLGLIPAPIPASKPTDKEVKAQSTT